jgi:hypothetical protein
LLRKFHPTTGVVTTVAGHLPTTPYVVGDAIEGTGTVAAFSFDYGNMAVDPSGNIWLTAQSNHLDWPVGNYFMKITPAGVATREGIAGY